MRYALIRRPHLMLPCFQPQENNNNNNMFFKLLIVKLCFMYGCYAPTHTTCTSTREVGAVVRCLMVPPRLLSTGTLVESSRPVEMSMCRIQVTAL